MNIVKTNIKHTLLSQSLNSTLQILLTVDYWYKNKEQKINQRQRKHFKEKHGNLERRIRFNIQDMSHQIFYLTFSVQDQF